ncbi:MAG TPA: SDR family NAD(P)-dependent oxidoreductase [Arthrobacter sp.]|nr:SDR family NAD(P)-dependent oxidoreductase [Arthrobacter sp.]
MASMDGTAALVTGAAGGLGQAVATGLAREGAEVVVVGRSAARVDAAVDGIRRRVPGARPEPLVCDLAAQSSIRPIARKCRRRAWARTRMPASGSGTPARGWPGYRDDGSARVSQR